MGSNLDFSVRCANEIDDFWAQPVRNVWTDVPPLRLYIRRSRRLLNDTFYDNVFDIAVIEVEPEFRGQGYFCSFLEILEQKMKNIFVESILEPRLFSFLQKRGYIISGQNAFLVQ